VAGNIAQRPNGRWLARFRDEAGVEHTKTFRRKVDGQRWLDEVTAAVVTGQYVDPRAGRETVRQYAERWRAMQDHRPGTEALYERVLRLHLYPVLGDLPLRSVKHSQARAFVSGLSRSGLSANTARQVHAITRTIFRSAVADRLIPSTPFEKIALPRVQRGEVQPPTLSEVRRLLDAAPDRLRALVLLAAMSGLRSGELLGLTVDRVDFLRREVRVDRQLVYVSGRPPYLGPPKTPESVRTVPVPAFVLDVLAAHLASYPVAADGLVFQADKGGPILRTTLNGRWRAALRRAELADTVHLHHLRHGYASWLNAAGVPFTTVSELLGHAPQGVTWGIYTHRVDGWDRQVRGVLETLWRDAGADYLRTAEGQ
jgi:integrase